MSDSITLWFNHSISSLDVILRALRSDPVLSDCRVIVTNQFPASNLMTLCDFYLHEPKFQSTADYVEWCKQFALDNEVDFFFPQRAADQILMSHDQFKAGDTEVVMHTGIFDSHLIDSKSWVYGDLEAASLGAILPSMWTASDNLEHIRSLMDQYPQTLCVKPDRGIYGEGFFVLDKGLGLNITQSPPSVGVDTLSSVFPYLYKGKPCIVSEFLPGKEYSVDCAFHRGELLSAVVRKKSSRKHQHVFTPEDQSDPRIASLFSHAEKIGRVLTMNGWSNMQFKEDEFGHPKFLEVNPRFSGGLGIAAMANPMLPLVPIYDALSIWNARLNDYRFNGEAVLSSYEYAIM